MLKKFIAVLSIILVSSGLSIAAVMYSTIPAGNTINSMYSFAVGGPTSPWGEIDIAASFIAPDIDDLYVDSVEVGIIAYSMPTIVDVMIMTDNASRPGTILQTSQITAPANAQIITAEFVNNLLLTADSKYWVCVSVQSSGQLFWRELSPRLLTSGDYNCRHSNDNWQTSGGYSYMPAFRVNGIPEPATIALLGIGALSVIRRKTT